MAKILVVGGGGREHSLAIYLSKSAKIHSIYVLPGNAGTEAQSKCFNLKMSLKNFDQVTDWCISNNVSLVVVGPEEPLINGLCDVLREKGISCFGPSASAARLEGSKEFGKEVLAQCGIATARYATFTEIKDALSFLDSSDEKMRVIKADGIAAGKGVVVATSLSEAKDVVLEMLDKKNPKFGSESSKIIIEEELTGFEISVLAFTDGVHAYCFPPCQDHKRIFDGDLGPNTGGMGAYCPCDLIDEETLETIEKNIVQKVVDHMHKVGSPYQGIIYVGLIITEDGPRVLEFNCRFGDPETQVLLPLLKTDLFDVMMACSTLGGLMNVSVEFYHDRYAMCIVLSSGGYPGSFSKNFPISGIDKRYPLVDIIHAGTILNEESGQILTNGGRVLSVVSVAEELFFCYNVAMDAASKISFQDSFYRKDIGYKTLSRMGVKRLTYANCGVNIAAGDELVTHIKSIVGATNRSGTVSEIGQFGAMFDLRQCGYEDPLLISGTDGVGTKLKIALQMNKYDSIGQDLVAMCVNDILCHGAEPLFFLDYFASGKLNLSVARSILSGISSACQLAGCSLIGGETAEMPGMYHCKDYDLAGFVVGAVERREVLPRLQDIVPGDCVIGLASSGLHSNGFSMVRRIISSMDLDSPTYFGDCSLGSILLTPTTIYVKPLLNLLRQDVFKGHIRSLCHITGGGLPGNLPRSLSRDVKAVLDTSLWKIPPIFSWLWQRSGRNLKDFSRTFNLGIGMTVVVSQESAGDICDFLSTTCGVHASVIGHIFAKVHLTDDQVVLKNLEKRLDEGCERDFLPRTPSTKVKVGVLISGSGTNLQALLKYSKDHEECAYEVVLVISNVPDVKGLGIARMYGVPALVLNHRSYPDRRQFDEALDQMLSRDEYSCGLICLAGFMRILGPEITAKWHGRMLNIHPSLLPSFRGAHAHREVLKSGVQVSGATVHFVVAEVDSGGIIAQQSIQVMRNETEESLSERVKTLVEHHLYPEALDQVARGECWLTAQNEVRWRTQ